MACIVARIRIERVAVCASGLGHFDCLLPVVSLFFGNPSFCVSLKLVRFLTPPLRRIFRRHSRYPLLLLILVVRLVCDAPTGSTLGRCSQGLRGVTRASTQGKGRLGY